jgi:hypothetical protein
MIFGLVIISKLPNEKKKIIKIIINFKKQKTLHRDDEGFSKERR